MEITTEKGSNFQKSRVWFNIAPPQDFTEHVKLHLVVNPNNTGCLITDDTKVEAFYAHLG